MRKSKSFKQLQQISTATLLEESGHLRLATLAIVCSTVILIALLIWASLSKITETAVTTGEIVPQGKIQVIQHLEGGTILQIFVKDGDHVRKNQLLAQLDPTTTLADVHKLKSQFTTLTLKSKRLRAYINKLDHQFLKPQQITTATISSKYTEDLNEIIADNQSLLSSQNKKRRAQRAVLTAQLAQSEEKIRQLQQEKITLDKNIELMTQEFEMYKKLTKTNILSRKDFLVILRGVNKAQGEKASLLSMEQQAKQALIEAQNRLYKLDSELYETALQELNEINEQRLQVSHTLEKAQKRLHDTNINAPVTGIIKDITIAPSSVIAPGGVLMEIVPMEDPLVVSTRIDPRDIGHIHTGAKATIKVMTYDFTRYGSVSGKIQTISASTSLTPEGTPFYKAIITLDQQHLGAQQLPLLPGMTVQADIITGKKSLLQYLLKPIHRSIQSAFHER
ncbi:HlyD family type I secretion periplasmic adaptor subunit [Piscirickettsia litoralis]|uniref:Membrane fusion protein (MFP) family protein n=1 Tax=Piscirickettsia litoralis TaxID=1891921 RepID=A0ABX3A400_9GAMM|nr:HlyD family type I secretion periplasmic adaptor subunit [Piscirickettsia litoralis]ODN42381.1 secretion protein HlyD [Piscirickettsia litoralis]